MIITPPLSNLTLEDAPTPNELSIAPYINGNVSPCKQVIKTQRVSGGGYRVIGIIEGLCRNGDRNDITSFVDASAEANIVVKAWNRNTNNTKSGVYVAEVRDTQCLPPKSR